MIFELGGENFFEWDIEVYNITFPKIRDHKKRKFRIKKSGEKKESDKREKKERQKNMIH